MDGNGCPIAQKSLHSVSCQAYLLVWEQDFEHEATALL